MSDLEYPAKMFILNSADSGQTSKTSEQGCTPKGIVHGQISLAIIQERTILEAGGYKHQASRLCLES